MIGIPEMFAEFDGYDRYESEIEQWSHFRHAAKARQSGRYLTPTGRLYQREYKRGWYEVNRERWNAYVQERRARLRAAAGKTCRPAAVHGSRTKYVAGCRCDACRCAETAYRRERRRQIREAA